MIRSITVGLLWHSISSGNLGVRALTESQIAICQAAAQREDVHVKYIIFGNRGSRDYPPAGVDFATGNAISIRRMLFGRSGFLDDIRRCDVVFDIGEGDSFTDVYGLRRFARLLASKVGVLATGKTLVLSPQTIGPFGRWYTRLLATIVMKRCLRVFARDELSMTYLRDCGVTQNIHGVVDVAFQLPYLREEDTTSGLLRIGLNVSGLLFSGGYTGDNQFGLTLDYAALVRRLLTRWTARPENEVWLIPHVLPEYLPRDDDRLAIDQLVTEFPNARRAPNFGTPGEAKSFIAGLDFMTGARMHACIAAFSAGVPVVPLAYSRKFNGLFSTLGYRWVADGKTMTIDAAEGMILEGFERRQDLRSAVEGGNKVAREKLAGYEDFVAMLFREARSSTG